MHRYAGLRYGALDGEVRVSLAEVFQHADGTLDGNGYLLIRELVATGDRSMVAPARAALERYAAERNCTTTLRFTTFLSRHCGIRTNGFSARPCSFWRGPPRRRSLTT